MSASGASDEHGERWRRPAAALFVALLVSGFLVRIAGITFGLGHEFHPDEWRVVSVALAIRGNSVWDVSFWNYPPALANLAACVVRVVPAGQVPAGAQPELAARLVVVALSIVALAATGLAAARIAGRVGGLCALAVLAFSPLHVENSRYATTDVPTSTGVALVLLATACLMDSPTTRRYLLAGAAVGVAAAFKYVGALAGVAVVAAHLASGGARSPRRWAALAGAAGIALASAVLLDFQVLRHVSACLHAIADESGHYAAGARGGYGTPHAGWHALVYSAEYGVGPVAAALALASPLAFLRGAHHRMRAAPALAMAATYLLFVGTRGVFFARNLAHVLPALAVLAGVGLEALLRSIHEARTKAILGPAMVAAAAVVPAAQSVGFAHRLMQGDTRLDAAAWMRAEMPAGSRVAVVPETYSHYLPPESDSGVKLVSVPGLPSAADLTARGFTYVLVSSGTTHRYLRTPDEDPEDAARFAGWHASLERDASLVRTFCRPPGPGGNLFGATVDIYHNPTIEVFALPR